MPVLGYGESWSNSIELLLTRTCIDWSSDEILHSCVLANPSVVSTVIVNSPDDGSTSGNSAALPELISAESESTVSSVDLLLTSIEAVMSVSCLLNTTRSGCDPDNPSMIPEQPARSDNAPTAAPRQSERREHGTWLRGIQSATAVEEYRLSAMSDGATPSKKVVRGEFQ